jgi:hypothetical protein
MPLELINEFHDPYDMDLLKKSCHIMPFRMANLRIPNNGVMTGMTITRLSCFDRGTDAEANSIGFSPDSTCQQNSEAFHHCQCLDPLVSTWFTCTVFVLTSVFRPQHLDSIFRIL